LLDSILTGGVAAEQEFDLLDVAAALAAELGAGAAHVVRRQLLDSHLPCVLLNDLKDCTRREIKTRAFCLDSNSTLEGTDEITI
jgi:hypothetical protein